MRVLLATNHLFRWTGSEVQISLINSILKKSGAETAIYSNFKSETSFLLSLFEDTKYLGDLQHLKSWDPDIAYVQHHSMAIQIRALFPELPILHAQLGVLPHLERLPPLDISPSAYLPISEEVMDNCVRAVARFGFANKDMAVFRNIVDDDLFYSMQDIGELNSVVIYSYKLGDDRIKAINDAVSGLGVKIVSSNRQSGDFPYSEVPNILRMGEMVVASGRGAIEAMLCGKVPLIMANCGDDGLVTPANFHELMKYNFSGRCHGRKFSGNDVERELKAYKKEYGPELCGMAKKYFGRFSRSDSVNAIFEKYATSTPKKLSLQELEWAEFFAETYASQRDYSRHESWMRMRNVEKGLQEDLSFRVQRIAEMEHMILGYKTELAKIKAQVDLLTDLFGSEYSGMFDRSGSACSDNFF